MMRKAEVVAIIGLGSTRLGTLCEAENANLNQTSKFYSCRDKDFGSWRDLIQYPNLFARDEYFERSGLGKPFDSPRQRTI